MDDMAEPDIVDRRIADWVGDLPGLDLEVEGIIERIQHLEKRISKMLDDTLAEFGLNKGEWAVLGSLRRAGEPYRRSPGKLAKQFGLTTGAMTNRLDKLEEAGFVRRLPDPDDRRAVIVELLPEGREVWERAVGAQAAKEQFVASGLNERERKQLNGLLRRMVHASEREAAPATLD
jgi:DNA-binding MarR family transcriptional regulator